MQCIIPRTEYIQYNVLSDPVICNHLIMPKNCIISCCKAARLSAERKVLLLPALDSEFVRLMLLTAAAVVGELRSELLGVAKP